jgi:iron(III) transport system ATP-binding protein
MGREVAVLRGGRLVQTATPAALYTTPVDLEVARFVGEAVVVPGRVNAGRADCGLGSGLPVRVPGHEGVVLVMVRPEQLRLVPEASAGGVAAEVMGRSYRGPDTFLKLVLRDEARTPIVARAVGEGAPAEGAVVRVEVEGPVTVYPAGEASAAEGSPAHPRAAAATVTGR